VEDNNDKIREKQLRNDVLAGDITHIKTVVKAYNALGVIEKIM
jgi:hypothetical protein